MKSTIARGHGRDNTGQDWIARRCSGANGKGSNDVTFESVDDPSLPSHETPLADTLLSRSGRPNPHKRWIEPRQFRHMLNHVLWSLPDPTDP